MFFEDKFITVSAVMDILQFNKDKNTNDRCPILF